MFGHVGRRTQNLVGRQIALIDRLEAEETDPDRLARAVPARPHLQPPAPQRRAAWWCSPAPPSADEHVAPAAARRRGPAGARPRSRTTPGSTSTCRTTIVVAPGRHQRPGADAGRADGERDHLLAAAHPGRRCRGRCQRTAPGCAIVDHGIGMSAERLAEENARLTRRERLDLAPDRGARPVRGRPAGPPARHERRCCRRPPRAAVSRSPSTCPSRRCSTAPAAVRPDAAALALPRARADPGRPSTTAPGRTSRPTRAAAGPGDAATRCARRASPGTRFDASGRTHAPTSGPGRRHGPVPPAPPDRRTEPAPQPGRRRPGTRPAPGADRPHRAPTALSRRATPLAGPLHEHVAELRVTAVARPMAPTSADQARDSLAQFESGMRAGACADLRREMKERP